MNWSPLDHLFQVTLMGVLILSAQAIARRVQRERLRTEAARLRSGLTVSLVALRDLYAENVRATIDRGAALISGRQQIGLLRTLLGRLISLDQAEIEAVMTACVAMERAESAMSVVRNKDAERSVAVPHRADRRALVQTALREACAAIEIAVARMAPERAAEPEASIRIARVMSTGAECADKIMHEPASP